MHTPYYMLALLYATLLYADFLLVWLHTPCFTLIEQALSVFFNVNYI